ncbi:hypothetical protein [Cellulosimicrobium cellulans]|uniref:hypothetical protein n=1 Tax=Cellulosimicrobium cellulans TaxID=1710 RepID=UPI000848CE34|nr:hypothetical protein [Cellulosimicrobium cellulans]
MRAVTKVVALSAAAAGAAAWWSRRSAAQHDDAHVLAVTVHRSHDELSADLARRRPAPLADLGDGVRLDTAPAPKDFGSELRLRVEPGADVDVHDARQALRLTKQLLETGTVMPPDEPLVRRRTLTSLPLEAAIRKAGTEGRL